MEEDPGLNLPHHQTLRQEMLKAYGGKLDLLLLPEAKAPAMFGANIAIINGVSPAFADCGVDAKPDYATMWFVNRRLQLGLSAYDTLPPGAMGSLLMDRCFREIRPRNSFADYAFAFASFFACRVLISPSLPNSSSGLLPRTRSSNSLSVSSGLASWPSPRRTRTAAAHGPCWRRRARSAAGSKPRRST